MATGPTGIEGWQTPEQAWWNEPQVTQIGQGGENISDMLRKTNNGTNTAELQKIAMQNGGILPRDFLEAILPYHGGKLSWEATELVGANPQAYVNAYGNDPTFINQLASWANGSSSGAQTARTIGQLAQNNVTSQQATNATQKSYGAGGVKYDENGIPLAPQFQEMDIQKAMRDYGLVDASGKPLAVDPSQIQQASVGSSYDAALKAYQDATKGLGSEGLSQFHGTDTDYNKGVQNFDTARGNIDDLIAYAKTKGPSEQAKYLQAANDLAATTAENNAVSQGNRGLAMASSSLAQSGGQRGGSAERMALNNIDTLLGNEQGIATNQMNQNLGILSNDEAQKLDILSKAPGLATALGSAATGSATSRGANAGSIGTAADQMRSNIASTAADIGTKKAGEETATSQFNAGQKNAALANNVTNAYNTGVVGLNAAMGQNTAKQGYLGGLYGMASGDYGNQIQAKNPYTAGTSSPYVGTQKRVGLASATGRY